MWVCDKMSPQRSMTVARSNHTLQMLPMLTQRVRPLAYWACGGVEDFAGVSDVGRAGLNPRATDYENG